jgi:hypothetical protein
MARPDPSPTQLDRDLADLKLLEIAKSYREVLDEAARRGSSVIGPVNPFVRGAIGTVIAVKLP